MQTTKPIAAFAALTLAVTACGGDDAASDDTTSATGGPATTNAGTPTAAASTALETTPAETAPPATTTPPETTTPAPLDTTTPATAVNVDERGLQTVLDQWRADVGAFGATLSIRVPGHDDIHLASGVDDRDPATPMPTDGTYLAMSITKTLVAAIALQLVDEGRLSLHEPVAAWLPELPNAGEITLAMLLGHTSGLGEWDSTDKVLQDLTRPFTPDEVLAENVAAPPYGQPGEGFAYSNGGYAAVGVIIERVLGQNLADIVAERITGPLALDDTWLGDGSERPTRHGWFSIDPDPDLPLDTVDFPHEAYATSFFGAAGLNTSSDDLLDWGEALYTGDLLGDESTTTMLEMRNSFLLDPDAPPSEPQLVATDSPTPLHYGLGAMGFCRDQNGCRPDDVDFVGHSGSGAGTRALVAHHLASGTTIAVHANIAEIELPDLAALLADVADQVGLTSPT